MALPAPDEQSGISEALRRAIEGTFAATAGQAEDSRERAGELLDEVAKRGREASADVVAKVEEELHAISERLAKLEASLRGGSKH